MTPEEALKNAEIMKAWAEGKQLQYRSGTEGVWFTINEPSFDFTVYEYRIKPKEKVQIPATQEELEYLKGNWFKTKNNGNIFHDSLYRQSCLKKSLYYILNHETKCWEEWE